MVWSAVDKIVIGDVTQEVTPGTSNTLLGTGTFDVLMRAVNEHIQREYADNRIKGSEYSTVYLGALNSVLDKAMAFTMEVDKSWLEAEILRLEVEKLELEKLKVTAETSLIDAQVPLIEQQTANAIIEGTVLLASECKLRAEFDVLLEQKLKLIAETLLLGQKQQTELAQTNGGGITADSILGKQRNLYQNQADGFIRDAEQKATDILVKTWSVRRTTDEDTKVNSENMLDDTIIGRMVTTMLEGVGTNTAP